MLKKIKKNEIMSKNLKKILINEKDKLEKINLIKLIANFYWKNVTGKYRDSFLEKELFNLGKTMYSQRCEGAKIKLGESLHIITETYLTGGHTRLLSNWIKFDNNVKPSVLIVNPENSEIPEWLVESVEQKNGKFYILQNTQELLKIQEIIEIMREYPEIILHIHPNDIITCLALSNLDSNQNVYFVNHADHTFSLGYNYSNCVLELSEDGKKMGKEKRGIKYSEVLPIPIEEKINFELENNIQNFEKKIVVSMASEYKYLPTEKYNFQDFIDKLLDSNKEIIFNLIGPSKNKIWEELKYKYKERFNLLGVLSKEKAQEELLKASIYIDSFPFASYTSLLQAIDLGLTSYSLKTEVADLDSLKLIKVENIELLVEKINESLLKNDSCQNLVLKNKVKEFHYKEAWQNRLNIIRTKKFDKKNTLEEELRCFNGDYEKLFLLISPKRILKVTYRQLLKLKLKNQIKILLLHLKKN